MYTVKYERTRDGIAQFAVTTNDQADWEAVGVWVGSDKTPRCCECSGRLVAMSASCAHAKAVKRWLKKNNTQLTRA